jgi:mannosyltransferase OCH1-like enzyme
MIQLPKTIYQTWMTKHLPVSIKSTIDDMLKINKNYEYQLFDDKDMLKYMEENCETDVFDCFNKLTIGAAKADLWRYSILYERGGIYIDVDSLIFANLDSLILNDGCSIISREKNQGKFVQWCLMFTPKHPILKICLDYCVENIKQDKIKSILELTGPVVYTRAINAFFGTDIYYATDQKINSIKEQTKVRCHGYDYQGYAQFQHPNKNELYMDKPHWTVEENKQFGDRI